MTLSIEQPRGSNAAPPLARRAGMPRVRLAGKLTALAAPGGGETQLAATARALRSLEIDAHLWRPWEDRFDDIDVLHLFGSEPEHLPLVAAARARGVKVALSTIAWFDLASTWRQPGKVPVRVYRCAKHLLRAAAPSIPSWRRRLYHAVDVLLPNSNAEARQLMRHFGVPAAKIHSVPNAADVRFAAATLEPFIDRFQERGFVLYPGRIEPRKNQLGFLRAMRGSGLRIIVLGDAVPGEQRYLAACRAAADRSVRFLPAFKHDDPLLASAYAAAGCLALTSFFETPGLVALEAGLTGLPLVLTNRGCAREYFGKLARYVSPTRPGEIRAAVEAASNERRNPALARHVRDNFTWAATAEATLAAYEAMLFTAEEQSAHESHELQECHR